jgi:hypothetical protein
LDAAKNDEFLQNILDKNSKDGADGIKTISKEKARAAALIVVKKFRGLNGQEGKDYINANFGKTWDEHDIHGKNMIDVTEAYQFFNEL